MIFTCFYSSLPIRSILEVQPHQRIRNMQRQLQNKLPMVFPNTWSPYRLTCIPRMKTLISPSPTISFAPLSTHYSATTSVNDTSANKYFIKNQIKLEIYYSIQLTYFCYFNILHFLIYFKLIQQYTYAEKYKT